MDDKVREFLSNNGKKGGKTTLDRYGVGFYSKNGRKGGISRAINWKNRQKKSGDNSHIDSTNPPVTIE